jgi:quinol monooxygenase YgiN
MLPLVVILTVKDKANVAKVADLLKQQCTESRREPGCRSFHVYHSNNDDAKFVLVEHWESQAAIDEHRKAKAYTTIYQPHVLPLVDREPHPSTLLME